MARKLNESLRPSSPIHLKCDKKWLKDRAVDVRDLLKKLPQPQPMEFDMFLVMKGLKRGTKRAPVLNVEDLYD
jgi:hypothetical protein